MEGIRKRLYRRRRIRRGIRKKIKGTAARPRLSVYRSNVHIYAQLIDDEKGHTLCAASSLEKELLAAQGTKTEKAAMVGKLLAERAREKGIASVVFDRGGFRYHGRVRRLAEAAREEGLQF